MKQKVDNFEVLQSSILKKVVEYARQEYNLIMGCTLVEMS
ncbi:hypothetical protein HMPREF0519_0462 [Lentilactobacillus hilgardii DSM 20176 = ATCC 8290]|uniref:Uncharacterized protein n=1 Tax=Lentilactobacillus hilgardii (strain ATCC 8290 / DSM 20176 / CCUG 30140 / JCM 1155 / KCTC 3500 / NBRC 15886 / NCIMB 8040 / NRRL B-1843 / 9) TaxID=1423757 RepID=C0XGV1_LENH9|nr:hypothetical protein HMPREF0519_0462 [Lentilactobacillus hilgardii DSM 20176 = ATCC 8290]